jgi:hypothetical protein
LSPVFWTTDPSNSAYTAPNGMSACGIDPPTFSHSSALNVAGSSVGCPPVSSVAPPPPSARVGAGCITVPFQPALIGNALPDLRLMLDCPSSLIL